ncbi:MAG: hypothetical protein A2Y17_04105 [Clostridiales bacterium GWF2_38_85]|nr:MAG: hypothetical protein A2Y17_04105 [Clostridiales bacterium GWF2_38_85]HBL83463.1 hypothetical protein [Clostridiales bacterium]
MYNFDAMIAAVPERRMNHTLGVCDTAARLAKTHFPTLNIEEVKAAAILHDITKYLTRDEHIRLCQEYNITLDELTLNSDRVLHQITAAAVAKSRFDISDAVYNAIRCHTTGSPDMQPLDMVILFADYIEPNRKYDGCTELRQYYDTLLQNCDPFVLEKSIIKALGMTVIEIMERDELLHPHTIIARNSMILKINRLSKGNNE